MRLGKRQSLALASGLLIGAFLGGVFLLDKKEQQTLSTEAQQALLSKYKVPTASPSAISSATISPSPTLGKKPPVIVNPSIQPTPEATLDTGTFRLGNFQRSEIKNGEKLWEVEAASGETLANSNKIKLKSPRLWLKQKDGTVIRMTSEIAVLSLDGNSLQAAEIKGKVVVVRDEKLTISTEAAYYDKNLGTVRCPGYARIDDAKLIIEGEELLADLNKKLASFKRNVLTTIQPDETH